MKKESKSYINNKLFHFVYKIILQFEYIIQKQIELHGKYSIYVQKSTSISIDDIWKSG